MEDEVLLHYGVKRRSGRYPWGSGQDPYNEPGNILRKVDEAKAKGMAEKDIAKSLAMSTSQLRSAIALAGEERKAAIMDKISGMRKDGASNADIQRETGIPESTIRYYISSKDKVQSHQIENTSQMLKDAIDKNPYLDVGKGVEMDLNISRHKMDAAVEALKKEGYYEHEVYIPQISGGSKWTIMKVLTKEPDINVVREHRSEIKPPEDWTEDGGITFQGIHKPINVAWDRLKIKYGDEGGVDRDGLIQMRRNVPDLDMGDAHYAQVRIAMGGTHYLKGMAVYSDDLPAGVDLVFNTNKPSGTPKEKVLKPLSDNKDNPFGATIKPGGQHGALNIVNEEGDWNNWNGSKFSSQFLSKQPLALIKDRLGVTYKSLDDQLGEIKSLTNPQVKKHLLDEFSDGVDTKTQHLKVIGLPKTKGHVLVPFPDMKPNEVYAPNYKDGERVVLIRYPHGGTFEIPELTVNNKYTKARKAIGNAPDAIGIHPSVAHKLSGADFDGDAVYVIPNNDRRIKTSSSLKGLENFDPNIYQVDHKTVKSDSQKQHMMGKVSNLITDMTIKGASTDEVTRAVRHSMVVIDSVKHQLDWKQSEIDNGIAALRKKYQTRPSVSYDPVSKQLVTKGKGIGGSTIISRSKTPIELKTTKERYKDPETGRTLIRNTYSKPVKETYVDKNGATKSRTIGAEKVPLMSLVSDAHILSSGTAKENAYADYVNKLKALSNSARKTSQSILPAKVDKNAAKVYSEQVNMLKTKLHISQANAPRERRAQIIANTTYSKNVKSDMTSDQKKKLKSQALAAARVKAGAKRTEIDVSDKEWEAIQNHAISNTMLNDILLNANADRVKQLATPRPSVKLTSSKLSRARTMLSNGYTYAQVASQLGVSTSTLYKNVEGA